MFGAQVSSSWSLVLSEATEKQVHSKSESQSKGREERRGERAQVGTLYAEKANVGLNTTRQSDMISEKSSFKREPRESLQSCPVVVCVQASDRFE